VLEPAPEEEEEEEAEEAAANGRKQNISLRLCEAFLHSQSHQA
jgi:hypothetical protein